jgi:putative acyl-CoA dehydrogenase
MKPAISPVWQNRHPPDLERYDARGVRIDQVTFHPAYHALMRRSMLAGLHCSAWDRGEEEAGMRHRARAVRLYLTAQTEAGHLCPMVMTHAALASLRNASDLLGTWAPRILSRSYDRNFRPPEAKRSATIGMG